MNLNMRPGLGLVEGLEFGPYRSLLQAWAAGLCREEAGGCTAVAGLAPPAPRAGEQIETDVEGEGEGAGCQLGDEDPAVLGVVPPPPPRLCRLALPRMCANPFCGEFSGRSEEGLRLKKCGRCKAVQYCSMECQQHDWAHQH